MAEEKVDLSIEKLNELYNEAEQEDHDLFAEQRSNVKLVIGEHYNNKNSRFWSRVRSTTEASQESQRLRLTKNHIGKISKIYINGILNNAPGVTILPHNETELADQKAAEMHNAVWQDMKKRSNFKQKTREWASDFINVGECASKIFFDPNRGDLIGYSALMKPDEQTGQLVPALDITGQMQPDKKSPIFSGEMVFDRVFGFNLLRDAAAKSWGDSRHKIYRQMVDIKELQALVGNDEDKLKFIEESSKDTFTVYDGNDGSYKKTKGMAMLREFYFKPCVDYPVGYWILATEIGKLFEGELPFGIDPIEYEGFDEIPTMCRHKAIIKQIKPYQYEINRAASQQATHQITLGDDKLIFQKGATMAPGGTLPGIRGIAVSGMAPTILQGRSGAQFSEYIKSQIDEMYQVAGVDQEVLEKATGQTDPFALLYQSLRDKKKFSMYAEKFEGFLVRNVEKGLRIAKNSYSDRMLIPAIGRREVINIQEFRSSQDFGYQVKIEPQVEDVDSKMGKQLVMNNILQYVGPQMEKDDLGKLMRAMPYVNKEKILEDYTQDYDNLCNDILALDRGQMVKVNARDSHSYIVKGLIHRQKQADYAQLPLQVQQIYDMVIKQHEEYDAQQQAQIQAAKDGYIPTGGFLVAMDFYVPDPNNPQSTKRARVPSEAVDWLLKRIADQGTTQELIASQDQSAQADISGMTQNIGGAPQGMPPNVLPFPR